MKLSPIWQRIILIAALGISIAGYNLWKIAWHDFFYQCMALFITLLFILLYDTSKQDRTYHTICIIGFWFSVNNLLDELFFDPTKFGWNEYIFAAIIIVITILMNRKNARKQSRHTRPDK